MKKLLSIILMLGLLAGFSACGDDNNGGGEEFVWGGNWNDPTHPKYQEYQGNYNPIEGIWKIVSVDGEPDTGTGLEFTSGRYYYSLTFEEGTDNYERKAYSTSYGINDKALAVSSGRYWQYWLKDNNNTLVLNVNITSKDGQYNTYKRIK